MRAAENLGRFNGFYKIGLRYYDDQMGRWTQTDPLQRAINPSQPAEAQPYNYSGCNPTNQTDPTGAISLTCGVGIGLAAVGAVGLGIATVGIATATGGVGAAVAWGGFGAAAVTQVGGMALTMIDCLS